MIATVVWKSYCFKYEHIFSFLMVARGWNSTGYYCRSHCYQWCNYRIQIKLCKGQNVPFQRKDGLGLSFAYGEESLDRLGFLIHRCCLGVGGFDGLIVLRFRAFVVCLVLVRRCFGSVNSSQMSLIGLRSHL